VLLFERVMVVRRIVAARTGACKETVAPLEDTIFDRTELVRLILILGGLSRAHRASDICVTITTP
jgi:hypothetical protein